MSTHEATLERNQIPEISNFASPTTKEDISSSIGRSEGQAGETTLTVAGIGEDYIL
jgi:hypothetical protein